MFENNFLFHRISIEFWETQQKKKKHTTTLAYSVHFTLTGNTRHKPSHWEKYRMLSYRTIQNQNHLVVLWICENECKKTFNRNAKCPSFISLFAFDVIFVVQLNKIKRIFVLNIFPFLIPWIVPSIQKRWHFPFSHSF